MSKTTEILVTNQDDDTLDGHMSPLEIMKHLDERQRERYVAFQETFESAGWPLLVEWAEVKALEAEKRGMNVSSSDEWRILQGVRSTWAEVAQLGELFMNEFENAAQQNMIDAELAAEGDEFEDGSVTE